MFQLGGRNSLFPTQVKHSRTESAVIQTHADTSSRETDLILQNQHLYAKDYKCYFLLISSFFKIKIKYNTKANCLTPSQKGNLIFLHPRGTQQLLINCPLNKAQIFSSYSLHHHIQN